MRTIISVACAFFLIAACGGDGEAEGVASLESTTTTTVSPLPTAQDEVDQEAAAIALVECVRGEGIDVADPIVDSDGNVQFPPPDPDDPIDPDQLRGALDACDEELQAVVIGFTQDLDFTAVQDTLLEYAQCMRSEGFDLPDPDFSNLALGGEGPPTGPFGEVDFNDPDFAVADEACNHILADFGFGG